MTKKKDYPLRLCSTCAQEYADGGFTVEYAEPRTLIGGRRCDFCARSLPDLRPGQAEASEMILGGA